MTELPKNLQILSFYGNEVTKSSDYKVNLVKYLPEIENLDGKELSSEEKFRLLGIFPSQLEPYSIRLK